MIKALKILESLIMEYDIHIKNGEIIDGTGAPKFKSDIVSKFKCDEPTTQYIKDKIIDTGNKYLFSVPYSPETNPIETVFSV